MVITRSKVIALIIALSYVVVPVALEGWNTRGVGALSLFVALPLALIWFPDQISEVTRWGNPRRYAFNQEVPEPIVTLLGWLGLLGYLPLLFYLL